MYGAEMLVEQIGAMKRDSGEKLHYNNVQDVVHNFIIFLFCESERTLCHC